MTILTFSIVVGSLLLFCILFGIIYGRVHFSKNSASLDPVSLRIQNTDESIDDVIGEDFTVCN
jgi:hypothetical protein